MTFAPLAVIFVASVAIAAVAALPVIKQTTTTTTPVPVPEYRESPEDQLSYNRYLQEIVSALEDDEHFKEKLSKAEQIDIRNGQIAHELEFVHHHVRTKLDEIKRREIDRLRDWAEKQMLQNNAVDHDAVQHIDHHNRETFEIDDLKRLILKTSKDLDELDRQRRAEFKEYELQKEYEKQQKLEHLQPDERTKYQHELEEKEKEHLKHEKIHYPGNRAQLEEVWEKEDHMAPEDFDPKAFFRMHDVDSNGFWDEYEVAALFQKELDKAYNADNPNDDMIERAEEMERMREEVFHRADTNHDNLISLDEFIAESHRNEFNEDPNWKGVDEQPQYTHDEYAAFEKAKNDEVQKLIAEGKLPTNYYDSYPANPNDIPHGDASAHKPDVVAAQQQNQHAPVQSVPQQVPVQQQQQHQQAPVQQQQVPVQQQYQQVPVQQQQPQYQQVPVQQQQVPVQQQYQQVPVQQQQIPVQQQQQYQQVPVQQQQVPVQQQYQQVPVQQQQVPVQQQQVPVQQYQQAPVQQQQVPNQAQFQQAPVQQQFQQAPQQQQQFQQPAVGQPIVQQQQQFQQPAVGQPVVQQQPPSVVQQH